MKTKKYTAVFAVALAVTAMTSGCIVPDDAANSLSTNLGATTRDKSAYRYNYDYSGGDMGNGWTNGGYGTNTNTNANGYGTNNSGYGTNTNGYDTSTGRNGSAAYWDYYGISNGSANDSVKGLFSGSNKMTGNNQAYGTGTVYGTPSSDAAISNISTMDSAALAD